MLTHGSIQPTNPCQTPIPFQNQLRFRRPANEIGAGPVPTLTIMNSSAVQQRLAVCSWSLQPADPYDLADKVLATGLRRVQLALDPLRTMPVPWGQTLDVLRKAGIEVVSGMFGCVGEDYGTLDSIRATGGIAPDSTWSQNLLNIQATARLAADLGLNLVTFHAGFVPHEPSDATHAKMLDRLAAAADVFAAHNLRLGLETGQETAASMVTFLAALNHPNVSVNFDPANLILYGQGDPVAAVLQLGSAIRQVHIKDARHTRVPGTWGEEVPVGTGEVDWPGFFRALRQINYSGDYVIEREAGSQRGLDVCLARELVRKLAP